jgi:hypothetical protein
MLYGLKLSGSVLIKTSILCSVKSVDTEYYCIKESHRAVEIYNPIVKSYCAPY